MTATLCLALALTAQSDDWVGMLKALRNATDFDLPNSPEAPIVQHVKSRSKAAYPHLIDCIDHTDLAVGRSAVSLLIYLTGYRSVMPHPANKAELKREWLRWLERSRIPSCDLVRRMAFRVRESTVREEIDALSSDDPERRVAAEARIEAVALPHAALLRSLHEKSADPEIRARLGPILERLRPWEDEAREVEREPRLLLQFLDLQGEEASEELREAVKRLYGELKKKVEGKPVKP